MIIVLAVTLSSCHVRDPIAQIIKIEQKVAKSCELQIPQITSRSTGTER